MNASPRKSTISLFAVHLVFALLLSAGCTDNLSGPTETAALPSEGIDIRLERGLFLTDETVAGLQAEFGYEGIPLESALYSQAGAVLKHSDGHTTLALPERTIEGVETVRVLRAHDRSGIAFFEIVADAATDRILAVGERAAEKTMAAFEEALTSNIVSGKMASLTFKFPWQENQGTWKLTGGYGHCPSCGYHAVDFNSQNDYGKNVLNPARGIVAFVGAYNGNGYTCDMNHGSGKLTRVTHLRYSPWNHTRVGHDLLQETKLGECGDSGNAEGAHIHFEYRVNNITKPLTGFSGYSEIVVGRTYHSYNHYVRPPYGS